MKQNQEIFRRYEKKYLLEEEQYQRLQSLLADWVEPDAFARSSICNIYYDTPDFRLIRASLEKPVYKEKLRLRSYGVPKREDEVFLEIKKKYKGIVYKRRVSMKLWEAQEYMQNNVWMGERPQILKEMDWMKSFYKNLQPAIYISYDRESYKGIEDGQLRFTFDQRVRWRMEALELGAGNYGKEILPEGYHLMEVKLPDSMPLWLVKIFTELNIRQTSFSKYGQVYEKEIIEMQTEIGGKTKYA